MAKPSRFALNEPLHIFQDDFFENTAPMVNHASIPTAARNRRPLQHSSNNVVLNPPTASGRARLSPHKVRTPTSPLGALKPSTGNKLQMISMAPPSTKPVNTDSIQKKPFLSKFKTVAQKPTIDASFTFGKENVHPTIFPAPGPINLNLDNFYPQKAPGKRALMDAPPIKEARPVKKQKTCEEAPQQPVVIPGPNEFPPIVDDGTKPGHSYATLIGMAILRSDNRRLTLAQIYKWISENYKFYKADDAGWQNSIRHNLSLHKAFYKMERPKDDPGKGNYWCIEPGMEGQFVKEKPTRKSNPANENVMSTRPETRKSVPMPSSEPTLPPPPAPAGHQLTQMSLPPLLTSQATIPAADISSDATIPISDAAAALDENADKADAEAALESLYSPLQPAMHSSPPIPRHVEVNSGTPPPLGRPVGSSASRSRKRKFASMDDSGYISSLESSVMRQRPGPLTSEADRPRIKRGRAEEEIARLRASSYDSPSKGRSWNGFAPPSSSPLRNEATQMLPPLTPAMKLRAPSRPPPSVSPNTNLRIHRSKVQNMLQSPLRRVDGILDESNLPWSPAFKLDDSLFNCTDTLLEGADFDIFQDGGEDIFADLANFDHSSPIKRSVKRQRLDRSQSTSALADITGSGSNKGVSEIPTLKIWDDNSVLLGTPTRNFTGMVSSPSKLFIQSPSKGTATGSENANLEMAPPLGNWQAMAFDPSDFLLDSTDYAGVDILQGFEKIGSGNNPQPPQQQHQHHQHQHQQPMPRSSRSNSKPGLSRYYSSAF